MFVGAILIRVVVAILAIVIPFGFGYYWKIRQHFSSWHLFNVGCCTFIISQIFHIPFNLVVLKYAFGIPIGGDGEQQQPKNLNEVENVYALAIFAGLSAGFFEEVTRYLAYKYYLLNHYDRKWKSAIMFGTGHGGIESILIVGLAGLAQVIGMTILRLNKDNLSAIGIPEDQIPLVQEQMQLYWGLKWYDVLLADVERIFAMTCHLAMTLLVLQGFIVRNNINNNGRSLLWLLAAITWHAILDATVVVSMARSSIYITELILAGYALISLWMILRLKDNDNQDDNSEYYEVISDENVCSEGTTEALQ